MKKVVIGIGLVAIFLRADVVQQNIRKMVLEIKSPRKSIALEQLSSVPDPFIEAKKDDNKTKMVVVKKKELDISLSGIINKKAYINGSWYKEGDKISSYTLEYVGTKGIVLVDGEQIRRIFLQKKNKLLILTEKGM